MKTRKDRIRNVLEAARFLSWHHIMKNVYSEHNQKPEPQCIRDKEDKLLGDVIQTIVELDEEDESE